jgi:hypothetical protein
MLRGMERQAMESPLCNAPGCTEPAGKSRGLCDACYRAGCRYVRRGLASWPEFVQLGLATRAKVPPRNSNPLIAALLKIRSGEGVAMAPSARAFVRPDNSSARVWSALVSQINRGAA